MRKSKLAIMLLAFPLLLASCGLTDSSQNDLASSSFDASSETSVSSAGSTLESSSSASD